MEGEDGTTVNLSPAQRTLHCWWLEYIDAVKRAARGGGKIISILNGDLAEGDTKDRTWQIVTRNPTTILSNMLKTFSPLIDIASKIFVVRGTLAHAGKSNNLECLFADDISAEVKDGQRVHWNLYGDFGGVVIDVAHFSRGGTLRGNNPMIKLAENLIVSYAGRGERIPELAFRSHRHQYRDSRDDVPGCRAIALPAWTWKTEFAAANTPECLADIGGAIVTIENGKANVSIKRFELARRIPREIKFDDEKNSEFAYSRSGD
jgi:hypothetical protein